MTVNRRLWRIGAAALAAALVVGCGKDSSQENVAAPTIDGSATEVASPSAPASPAGVAPTPRMLAIDRGALLRLSAAGKSIVTQAEQLQVSARGEFKAEADRLQADAVAYRQQQAILAPAVRAQKERELRGRQGALEQKMQARGGQIQAGINVAIQQIERQLGPVLQQIMQERKADIVVDRAAIVMAAPGKGGDMDITQAAVQRLDRILPRVEVKLTKPPAAGAAPRPAPGH